MEKEYTERDLMWHPIPDGPLTIDFSGCRNWRELHDLLKESFGFPNYYGRNWSALWDLLSDFCIGEERTVTLRGFDEMPAELRKACKIMVEVFDDAAAEFPDMHFIWEK